MSYIVNLPDGTLLTTILDGTVDNTASSLTLVGRNYSGYGEIIAEDLVALLVNFADNSAPNNALEGQIWYDTDANICKVYTGSAWRTIGSATVAASAPVTTVSGDLWWDSVNQQFYVYNGADWILVGPGYSNPNGKSGAIWEQLSDGTTWHDVVSMYLDNTRYAIISQDQFVPNVSITGFSTLQVGWNMSTNSTQGFIWGSANNASYLGGQPLSNLWTNYQNNSGTGNLTILNDSGITLGASRTANITTVSNTLVVWNRISNADIDIYATTSGIKTKYLHIDGTIGEVQVAASPNTDLGIATKIYVDQKANIASPIFTGDPHAPTPADGDNDTSIATTAFVQSANLAMKGYVDGLKSGTDTDLSFLAPKASPTLTGTPVAPNAAVGTNSAQIATTAFVYQSNVGLKGYVDLANTVQHAYVNGQIAAANAGVTAANVGMYGYVTQGNTIQTAYINGQISAANAGVVAANVGMLGYVDLANTIQSEQLSLLATISNPLFTGNPQAPTRTAGNSSQSIATTAFVQSAIGALSTYKIQTGTTWMWTDTAAANIVVSGTTVLSATSSGVVLNNGATATTQSQVYNGSGDTRVATTAYAKTATTWWGGSAKFVSSSAPTSGDGNDGDFWFQY